MGNELKTSQKQRSRRRFLKLAGAATVTTTIAGAIESCAPAQKDQAIVPSTGASIVPIEQQYPEVPYTPDSTPVATELKFFSPEEAHLVEALTARILPGTPEDPGAREAGVAIYIDRKLAFEQNNGFAEPTYFKPPFAKLYEGDTPVQNQGDEKTIWVKKSEIDRYGFQSNSTPQDTYRKNLAAVDQYAQMKFQKRYVDLSENQQDQILTDMENGDTQGFEDDADRVFFKVLRQDTIEGVFADPAYGGNQDMVGWKLINYPGAQRAYTPVDIHTEGNIRPPQSILQLHKFHPGELANPDVIVPSSGSDIDENHQP